MIRQQYKIAPYGTLYWVLDAKRNGRIGRFEPLPSMREDNIAYERKRALHNKHTVGTA
jgi:hypothetical protein